MGKPGRPRKIEFKTGQAVAWPHAPGRLAQVEELRKSTVRIFYRCKTGRERRPIVDAVELWKLQQQPHDTPPLPVPNPMGRGALPRRKRYRSTRRKGDPRG